MTSVYAISPQFVKGIIRNIYQNGRIKRRKKEKRGKKRGGRRGLSGIPRQNRRHKMGEGVIDLMPILTKKERCHDGKKRGKYL
ncbi:MAG: hypothetical protein Q4C72_00980 [Eubacteriales bacterium]|nr:hypothetical protein [Eubacteriales bacterium]